ncbi:MAG: hypothetical protein AAGK05_13840, partial [Pseudomonadota bacterium]
ERKWTHDAASSFAVDLNNHIGEAPAPHYDSPYAAFSEFLSSEMLDLIIMQSNTYAIQKGRQVLFTREKVLCSLGFLFFSGYHNLPQRRLYWEKADDVNVQFTSNHLRRCEFENFLANLHLADNSQINEDRYYKVRPIFDIANKNFSKVPLSQRLCVDEHIVRYYGRHSTKKFIRGKPIRYGYELFGIASPNGFLHYVEPSCGSSTRLFDSGLGHGPNIVLSLVEKAKVLDHSDIYFDNRFTTLPLLDELSRRSLGGTGTLRENFSHGIPLEPKSVVEKSDRGHCNIVSCENIEIVRWKDNRSVTIASNCHHTFPIRKVERWSAKNKKIVSIDCPNVIVQYNRFMGGCDLHDQYHYMYEIPIRMKKWWWPLCKWIFIHVS